MERRRGERGAERKREGRVEGWKRRKVGQVKWGGG
jgi:hypothetical protein